MAPSASPLAQPLSPASRRWDPILARVRVLGPLFVEGVDRLLARRTSTDELIAYLALHREGGTRDELIEALWAGSDPLLARQRLWQSTSEARRLLGEGLVRERDRYKLDRRRVWVDADELDAIVAEIRRQGSDIADTAGLERAFALFRGEPLTGGDYLWAAGEIRRLRAILVDVTRRLARLRLDADDVTGALSACEFALRADELSEPVWRLAMEAEHRLGLRSAVLARYELLRRVLAERVGLEPERETRLLFRALMAQS